MLFNSYVFVLLFLPFCLVGYFGLARYVGGKVAKLFLLGMSLWFYGYFNLAYLCILIISIVINYGFYRLAKFGGGGGREKFQ